VDEQSESIWHLPLYIDSRTLADDEAGLSKLANLLFAKQLQKIFNTEGIQVISVSLHPGGIRTGKLSTSFWYYKR
jgi:hypothetical protein